MKTTYRAIIATIFMVLSISSFAQSKKDVIENLTHKLDSVVSTSTKERIEKNEVIQEQKQFIEFLEKQIASLNKMNTRLTDSLNISTSSYRIINAKYEELSKLVGLLSHRIDSLKMASLTVKAQSSETDRSVIVDITKSFYASLELTPEQNQKQFEDGDVVFNLDKFKSFLDASSIYPVERVQNLSGDYHERYNIKLLNIIDIKKLNNTIEVYTTVEYEVSELGLFQNDEKLILSDDKGTFILRKWADLKMRKMTLGEYEGLEDYKESDFYKLMGSVK